jgi:hypothetical protein
MPAKYEWMHEHFPFIPDSHLVFCGDKSIIAADFLIDDNAHHVRASNSRCSERTKSCSRCPRRSALLNAWPCSRL